jgi:hypothetical protein
MRFPRIRLPRFGCVGFLAIGWVLYLGYACFVLLWLYVAFFVGCMRFVAWLIRLAGAHRKHRYRRY